MCSLILHHNLCYFRFGTYSVVNMQNASSFPQVGYIKLHSMAFDNIAGLAPVVQGNAHGGFVYTWCG